MYPKSGFPTEKKVLQSEFRKFVEMSNFANFYMRTWHFDSKFQIFFLHALIMSDEIPIGK